MAAWVQSIITIVGAVLASSGFWALLQSKNTAKDALTQMVKGLGHEKIISLGNFYIARGYITTEEYEDLYDYLYKPYTGLKGNGSAERMMEQVKRLPSAPPKITKGGDNNECK